MRTESDACHIWIVVIVEISLETRRTFLEVWTAQRAFRWRSLYSIGKTGWWCAPFWYGAGNFLGRIQAFAEIDNTSRKISRFKVNTYSAVCINAKPIENLQQICAFAVVHSIWCKNYCLSYMSTMSTSNIYSISTLWLGRACPPMTLSYLHPTPLIYHTFFVESQHPILFTLHRYPSTTMPYNSALAAAFNARPLLHSVFIFSVTNTTSHFSILQREAIVALQQPQVTGGLTCRYCCIVLHPPTLCRCRRLLVPQCNSVGPGE